jgi:hypothetical protein
MTSGAQNLDGWFLKVSCGFHGIHVGFRVLLLLPGCSFWLPGIPGTEVYDARDDSWSGSFVKRLYLVAMPSQLGVDVDGLAYPVHWPTSHSCQARG